MDKGKPLFDPCNPEEESEGSNFDTLPVWREVSNLDLWRIRDNESFLEFRERMKMIQTKVDRYATI